MRRLMDEMREASRCGCRGRSRSRSRLGVFIMIGERTNVAGSPKFARLMKEGKFEEAVSVARQQVENGANVIDICMDEGMIDGVAAMTRFCNCWPASPRWPRFRSWWTRRSGR
jgi:cobalamin-dependent methionine synthase I